MVARVALSAVIAGLIGLVVAVVDDRNDRIVQVEQPAVTQPAPPPVESTSTTTTPVTSRTQPERQSELSFSSEGPLCTNDKDPTTTTLTVKNVKVTDTAGVTVTIKEKDGTEVSGDDNVKNPKLDNSTYSVTLGPFEPPTGAPSGGPRTLDVTVKVDSKQVGKTMALQVKRCT